MAFHLEEHNTRLCTFLGVYSDKFAFFNSVVVVQHMMYICTYQLLAPYSW